MVSSTNKRVIGTFTPPNCVAKPSFAMEILPEERTVRASVFCACDIFFNYHPQGNNTKCHPRIGILYGNFKGGIMTIFTAFVHFK